MERGIYIYSSFYRLIKHSTLSVIPRVAVQVC